VKRTQKRGAIFKFKLGLWGRGFRKGWGEKDPQKWVEKEDPEKGWGGGGPRKRGRGGGFRKGVSSRKAQKRDEEGRLRKRVRKEG
jgi:hypothetical protein